ncbi:MAG TPA: PIN domain-containing protein [Pyrinomonadaceae bacterium]|nr:PIN domain-containing protein [Pyrinomonadaceae bacterium]
MVGERAPRSRVLCLTVCHRRGDTRKRRVRFACRLEAIADFSVLEVNEEVEALAREYFAALKIPEKAKIDAFHLAVAAWHRMDYVLSWNCKHIASGRVQKMLQDTNARLGVYTPIVCTPEELMEV